METVPSPKFETAMSRLPSPFKSPTTGAIGSLPTAGVDLVAKVPSPLLSRMVNVLAVYPKFAVTISGRPSPLASTPRVRSRRAVLPGWPSARDLKSLYASNS